MDNEHGDPVAPDRIPIFLRWWGTIYCAPDPPTRLLEEPHRLLAEFGGSTVLLRQCACETCAAHQGLASAPVTEPDQVVAYLRAVKGPVEFLLVLERDMVDPMVSGETTFAVQYAEELAATLKAGAVACRIVVQGPAAPYPAGTWLRVTGDQCPSLQHILLSGMVGQAVVTEYSHAICTPGVAQMVLIEGRAEPFGHAWACLEPMDGAPSEDERARSRELCLSAAREFQRRNGWAGYVTLGTEVRPEPHVRAEIEKLLAALPALRAANPTSYTGNMKRLGKLVRALAEHPQGSALVEIATKLNAMVRGEPDVSTLAVLARWLEQHPAQTDRLPPTPGQVVAAHVKASRSQGR